jgi:hypothetical protein
LEKQPSSDAKLSDTKSAADKEMDSSLSSVDGPSDQEANQAEAPVLRRPPVRPVRPVAPAQPEVPNKVGSSVLSADSKSSKPELAAPPLIPTAMTGSPDSESELALQAALRQQPIPPPSEPKQYRAIGLVRGRYSSSEEEFTRGSLLSPDGVIFNSVLLGRVMSLVRNHVDLEKDHLWVVYPRTREGEEDLHLQIVGIWEPETLKRPKQDEENDSDADESDVDESDTDASDMDESDVDASDADESDVDASDENLVAEDLADPGLNDGYFSIRGEIVFHSPEEDHVVIKIQQAPRKNSQKAKAFKLSLKGTLDSPKTVGYFWDFDVQLQSSALMISQGKCIGLVPPRKKQPGEEGSRPRRPFSGGRGARGGRPGGGHSSRPSARREPVAKPVKRSEQPTSEG